MEKNKLDLILEQTAQRIENLKELQEQIALMASKISELQEIFYSEEKEIGEKVQALKYLFKEELPERNSLHFDTFTANKLRIEKMIKISIFTDEAIQNVSDNLNDISKVNLNYKLSSLPPKTKEKTKKI